MVAFSRRLQRSPLFLEVAIKHLRHRGTVGLLCRPHLSYGSQSSRLQSSRVSWSHYLWRLCAVSVCVRVGAALPRVVAILKAWCCGNMLICSDSFDKDCTVHLWASSCRQLPQSYFHCVLQVPEVRLWPSGSSSLCGG